MWVIFEGLDKSGKGTLEWEFLKATNFKHIVIDRGPAGYLTFDLLLKRQTKEGNNEYVNNVSLMKESKAFVVVYCKAPADIAIKRINEHNEKCPYNYEKAQELYDDAIETLYKNQGIKVIEVDTTKSIEDCINLILGGLK